MRAIVFAFVAIFAVAVRAARLKSRTSPSLVATGLGQDSLADSAESGSSSAQIGAAAMESDVFTTNAEESLSMDDVAPTTAETSEVDGPTGENKVSIDESDVVTDPVDDTPPGKFGRKDDRENKLSSEEAQKLDEEASKLEPDYFLPLAPVLYPSERDEADRDITPKIINLERDAKISLPDGTTVPYWQTLQYANRHFRLFITRFREISPTGKKYDTISDDERTRLWAMAGAARKHMISDVFKECVLARTNIPDTMVGVGKKHPGRGTPLSAEIFYEHLEHVYRGSYMQSSATKGAAAFANGPGINFNSKNNGILERKMRTFAALYAHESSHNMGYNHPDKIPGAMETCTKNVWKNNFQVYDLTEFPGFTVSA